LANTWRSAIPPARTPCFPEFVNSCPATGLNSTKPATGAADSIGIWTSRRDDGSLPEKHYIDMYRAGLEEAVSSHLMSDVPLGVFLSGGVDSSAVAALTKRIRQAPVETFSVGYEEAAFSELGYAQEVATHIGTQHHEVRVSRKEFFDALPNLIWHEDEPIVWPSSVALYFVARLARERVTVVLTGEGSDETLGGYGRYARTLWNTSADRFYRGTTPSFLRRQIRNSIQSELLGAKLQKRHRAHLPRPRRRALGVDVLRQFLFRLHRR